MLKKLNENKIYDHMEQTEKARLLFKTIQNQDGNTFDKLINSGKREDWTVRNHKARLELENMMMVALSWGLDYWKNQSTIGGTVALMQDKKHPRESEDTTYKFIQSMTANHAYILTLDRLEADYGMDKNTVLRLAGVGADGVTRKSYLGVMPNNEELLDRLIEIFYESYAQILKIDLLPKGK